jgi:Lar family restriction alleviation protein
MNKERKKREPIELKPCPFCGSTRVEKSKTMGIGPFEWISCRKCGAASGLRDRVIDAIAAWNLRVDKE